MLVKSFLKTVALLTLVTVGPQLAFAEAGGSNGGGGGGDMESEFKAIAKNLEQWINSGGSKGLKLDVTQAKYKADMLAELKSYSIQMVDRELNYCGSTKTCVSRKVDPTTGQKVRGEIICNQALFRDTYDYNMDGAYRLVHHEFAGLSNIEKNVCQDSDYKVSDQIAQHLEDVVIRRLPVGEIFLPPNLKSFACKNILFQTHDGSESESEGGPNGFGNSEISARDYVVSLFKRKNSFLAKDLKEKFNITNETAEDDFTTYIVGKAVQAGFSGRVESNSTEFLIPIIGYGKRWESVQAYVKVTEGFNWLHEPSSIPYSPKAAELRSLVVKGIVSIESPVKEHIYEYNVPYEDMTAANCRNVRIPKNRANTEY